MPTDWKAALAGLDLPQGPETPSEPASAPASEPSAAAKRRLNVFYEKKGRAGKPATIIEGFIDEADAREAASRLKQRLGVGGSARGCEVLLQGDQRQALPPLLAKLGYR